MTRSVVAPVAEALREWVAAVALRRHVGEWQHGGLLHLFEHKARLDVDHPGSVSTRSIRNDV